MTPDAPTRRRWRGTGPRARLLAGPLLSALLLWAYARGGAAWVLGFAVLVPWLLSLGDCRGLRQVLLSGWLMSLGYVVAALYWFGPAVGAYTGVGAVPATLLVLLLAPLLQPQLILFAVVRHLALRRHGPWLAALAGAGAWVGAEALLPRLLGDTLGHGLHGSLLLRQAADLGGAAGLTVLLVLVAEALARALSRWPRGLAATLRPLGLALAMVVAVAGYGGWRLATLPVPPAGDPAALRVAMVQASITDYERLRAEIGAYGVVRHVLDTHYALSLSAVRDHGADVLLWSETVYPTTFGQPRNEVGAELDAEIQGFVDHVGVPLVFGTYDLDAAGEYNAAAFLEPGRGLLGFYRKTHPFPLTEHVPGWLDGPLLRRALPWAGSWQPGDGARVLPLRSADGRQVEVLPLICLDDVHGRLAIDGARLGAQAIIGLSNDSWFSQYPAGARLHLQVAAFRSIETRLPQLRVTTNGLSAVIDDTGEVLAATGIGDQAVLTGELLPATPPRTLMVAWGDWVGRAGAVFVLGLGVVSVAGRGSAARAGAGAGEAGAAVDGFDAAVVLMTPALRHAVAVLRALPVAGMLWLALGVLRDGPVVHSLLQLQVFAGLVVLPTALAWALCWANAARVRVADGRLWIQQRHRRIEVPVEAVGSLQPWRWPLPGPGLDLGVADGPPVPGGLALRDPDALVAAVRAAGAVAVQSGPPPGLLRRLARQRAAVPRRWFDHALVKFVAFPLLPALVAFRLHQIIRFGGPFGEIHEHGLRAWLLGLGLWWASWALGLVLFAALLRLLVEAVGAGALALDAARARRVRLLLEGGARALYFLGVPAWLALRLLAG